MSTYDQLMQSIQDRSVLQQAQAQYDQAQLEFNPYKQKMHEATTLRFTGILPALIETIYDARKRKKIQPEYDRTLSQAMGAARGVDEIQAILQQIEAARQQDAQRQYDEQQALIDHQRSLETEGVKTDGRIKVKGVENQGRIEAAKARGANLTYNIPAGYMPVDPNNPMAGVVPIPGSKEAREIETANTVAGQKQINARHKYASILDEVEQAMEKVNGLTSGFAGAMISQVPGTEAYVMQRHLDTIKGNLGFDRLQQMRDESPTGGALGQVSNIELGLLTSALTALDPGLPPDQLQRNLQKVQRHYGNFLSALSGDLPEGYDETGNPVAAPQSGLPPLPAGFQPD